MKQTRILCNGKPLPVQAGDWREISEKFLTQTREVSPSAVGIRETGQMRVVTDQTTWVFEDAHRTRITVYRENQPPQVFVEAGHFGEHHNRMAMEMHREGIPFASVARKLEATLSDGKVSYHFESVSVDTPLVPME